LFEFDLFSSLVTGQRPDGTTLFSEKFVIAPSQHGVRGAGVMGKFDVFGNVLVLTPKVVGMQSEQVKRIVRGFLAVVRQQVTGKSLPPAFHWQ
jgi:hypothetical protein